MGALLDRLKERGVYTFADEKRLYPESNNPFEGGLSWQAPPPRKDDTFSYLTPDAPSTFGSTPSGTKKYEQQAKEKEEERKQEEEQQEKEDVRQEEMRQKLIEQMGSREEVFKAAMEGYNLAKGLGSFANAWGEDQRQREEYSKSAFNMDEEKESTKGEYLKAKLSPDVTTRQLLGETKYGEYLYEQELGKLEDRDYYTSGGSWLKASPIEQLGTKIMSFADRNVDMDKYKEPGAIGQFAEKTSQASAGLVSAIGSMLESKGIEHGWEKIEFAGDYIERRFQKVLKDNPQWQDTEKMEWTELRKYTGLLGTAVPSLVGTIGAGAVTTMLTGGNALAGLAVTAGTAYAIEGGYAYQRAKDMGASEDQARKARDIVGGINAFLEVIPGERIFKAIKSARRGKELFKELNKELADEFLKSGFRKGMTGFGKQAVLESITEGSQEAVSNAFFRTMDKDIGLFDGVLESMVAGAMGGGATSFAFEGNAGEIMQEMSKVKPGFTVEDVSGSEGLGGVINNAKEEIKRLEDKKRLAKLRNQDTKSIDKQIEKQRKNITNYEQMQNRVMQPQEEVVEKEAEPKKQEEETLEDLQKKLEDPRLSNKEKAVIEKQIEEETVATEQTQDNLPVAEKIAKKKKEKYYESEEDVKIYRVTDQNVVETRTVKGKELNNYTAQGTWSTQKPKTPPSIAKITGEQPSPFIRKRETTLLKDRIKLLNSGIKEGVKMTKEEIKTTQTEIVNLLKQSELSKEDIGKFVVALKNTQTQEQLEKNLPTIMDRIMKLEETNKKKVYTKKINNTLKSVTPTKQSDKKVGKLTPIHQKIIDSIKYAIGLTKEQADAERAAIIAMNQKGDIRKEDQIALLSLQIAGGMDTMTGAELETLYNSISAYKEKGQLINALKKYNRLEEMDASVEAVVKDIEGGDGKKVFGTDRAMEEASKPSTIRGKVAKSLSNWLPSMIGWQDIMLRISGKSGKGAGKSFVEKVSNVSQQVNAEKLGNYIMIQKVATEMKDAYGITDNGWRGDMKLKKKIKQSKQIVMDKKVMNEEAGVEVHLKFTKGELIKRWIEMQDPTLTDTFEGENMNYTPEMVNMIDNAMSPEDIKVAQTAMKIWSEYYDRINKVYENMYNISLDKNAFYSPIRRENAGNEDDMPFGEFMGNLQYFKSVAPGSVKARKKNINKIKEQSVFTALEQHISEMEHFIAWGEKVRELNYIFKNKQVKEAIKKNYGAKLNMHIDGFIDKFTKAGLDASSRLNALDKIRTRFTQGSLALKGAIGIKQLTSTFAYWEFLGNESKIPFSGAKDFIVGVLDFWTNPVGHWKFLKENSTFFKMRGENMERDVKALMRTDEYKAFRNKQSFMNLLMLNVKMGDQLAIAMGGWSVYKATLKRTGSREQAIRAFEEASSATQQSSDVDQLSYWQTKSSVHKLFTMFQTSPNQYFRREINALINLSNKRIDAQQFAKTITIYHFILPMVFQAVADLGIDDDKQKRAMILGSFNGIFIANDMLEMLVTAVLNETNKPYEKDERIFGTELPISTTVNDAIGTVKATSNIIKKVNGIDVDDITPEDFEKALNELFSLASKTTGVPFEAASNVTWQAWQEKNDGDYYTALMSFLGFTPYALQEQDKRKEFKTNKETYKMKWEESLLEKQEKNAIRPIHEKLKTLDSNSDEYNDIIYSLSDEEYDILEYLRQQDKTKEKKDNEPHTYELFEKGKRLKDTMGENSDEYNDFIWSMGEDEYEAFDKIRKSQDKIWEKPDYQYVDGLPGETEEKSLFQKAKEFFLGKEAGAASENMGGRTEGAFWGLENTYPVTTTKNTPKEQESPFKWQKKAVITVYNPEKGQTDDSPTVGGFMTKMEWGDIAIGNRDEYFAAKDQFKEGIDTYVRIPELKKITTPYGRGVFRVRDTMNKMYDGDNRVDIYIPNKGSDVEKQIRQVPNGSYYYEAMEDNIYSKRVT